MRYSKKKNKEWREKARKYDTRRYVSDEEYENHFKELFPNWREIRKKNLR